MAQIYLVGSESGGSLTFAYDSTAGAGSTVPTFEYQVVGWQVTGTPLATHRFFNNNNEPTKSVRNLDGKAIAVDLLTGTDNAGATTFTPTSGIFTGTAGTTLNFSTTIDISGFAGGFNDVSDYDYIGIRFHLAGDNVDLTAIGSTLDNVSLTPIPEPSELAFLGLGLLSMPRRCR